MQFLIYLRIVSLITQMYINSNKPSMYINIHLYTCTTFIYQFPAQIFVIFRSNKKKVTNFQSKKFRPLLLGTTVFLLASFDSISQKSQDFSSIHSYNTSNIHSFVSALKNLRPAQDSIDHKEKKKKKKGKKESDQTYTTHLRLYLHSRAGSREI